jgi:glycosyltransferase involved in cell wall biosynthesis
MTKRILQIIPTLDRSGAEKQMTLLVRSLPREEFEIQVAALTRGGPMLAELESAGIPVTILGKRWKFDPQTFWRLLGLVRRLKPDLIHTWIFAANTYGRAVGLLAGVKCLVAGERCVDPWKTWELWFDRYLARHTTRIAANSEGVREFYAARGIPAAIIEVIPNGIPPPPACTSTRQEILAELGFPATARLVGLIGRLWPQKRVKDAIWAADLLKQIRDDVHLAIVGDGPHRQRLEMFRDQCEIRDKVHFLGHRSDVPRLLPHFDVLWLPSAYEGQSNALMEAMAAGVPAVATDIPGTRELVVDGQTGYLVSTEGWPPNATTVNKTVAAGLARHTLRILDDPALAKRLGEAAQQRMRDEFSVEKMVARYADLYRRLLG